MIAVANARWTTSNGDASSEFLQRLVRLNPGDDAPLLESHLVVPASDTAFSIALRPSDPDLVLKRICVISTAKDLVFSLNDVKEEELEGQEMPLGEDTEGTSFPTIYEVEHLENDPRRLEFLRVTFPSTDSASLRIFGIDVDAVPVPPAQPKPNRAISTSVDRSFLLLLLAGLKPGDDKPPVG